MDNPPTQPDADSSENPESANKPKAKKELPVVSVPHENDMMAEEMADLFEEAKVTNKHGSSEPEAD